MRGRHCAVVSLPLIAGQARSRYDAVSLQGTSPVADMAPVVNYADQLKRPRPDFRGAEASQAADARVHRHDSHQIVEAAQIDGYRQDIEDGRWRRGRTLMVALTIAHGMAPKAARTPSIAESVGPAPTDNEANEAPVAAEPRLTRAVFLYRERREGIDGPSYAAQCASCINFIAESAMRGAVSGNWCQLFGSDFPIADDDACFMHAPWPDGQPCDGCIAHGADEIVEGTRGSVSPYQVGYRSDVKPRCEYCRHFDRGELECEAMESLNEKMPLLFDLDTSVKVGGKCNLFTPFPPPEMDNG